MNKYLRSFLHRGLVFGGFGPIVVAVIYFILDNTIESFSLNGREMFCAIISTYIIAFVQAGASVFNQIEHWSLMKSLLIHFSTLYVVYVSSYLVNSWIPFLPEVLILFTLIFVIVYFVIWITVFVSVKITSKKMNIELEK